MQLKKLFNKLLAFLPLSAIFANYWSKKVPVVDFVLNILDVLCVVVFHVKVEFADFQDMDACLVNCASVFRMACFEAEASMHC